jgi:hypothetical protein
MWEKPTKKCLFTLRVDDYAPAICELTHPLLRHYAKKIGAEFRVIAERRFPEWPPVYEKLQIYDLAQEMENDWNLYIDSDALVHPDLMDVTCHIAKDTVMHNGVDIASHRWKYDRFFRRDGRNIGSCNWFTVASDWCIELWKPLDDLTFAEARERIFPTVGEMMTVVSADHLIDDYTLSRNIAKYGLKFTTLIQVMKGLGYDQPGFFWHHYTIPVEEKVVKMREVLKDWKLN